MIELMVVIALAAILVGLAAPSFVGTMARKRMEGTAEVFGTDLQYARSEAVSRNLEVRLKTGAGGACYTMFVWRGAGECTCTPTVSCTLAAAATDPTEIKTVSFADTGTAVTAGVNFYFEPLRGMRSDTANPDPEATFSVAAAGPWQLRTSLSLVGRASTCSPSGSLKGYPSC